MNSNKKLKYLQHGTIEIVFYLILYAWKKQGVNLKKERKNYTEIIKKLESYSKEQLICFLRSYSSELKNMESHCADLYDTETKTPYMSSVLASGLKVLNAKRNTYQMSEEVHQKANSIIGYVQKNSKHNYTEQELMFTVGYIAIYYKIAFEKIKVS